MSLEQPVGEGAPVRLIDRPELIARKTIGDGLPVGIELAEKRAACVTQLQSFLTALRTPRLEGNGFAHSAVGMRSVSLLLRTLLGRNIR